MDLLPHSTSRPSPTDWLIAVSSLLASAAVLVITTVGLANIRRSVAVSEMITLLRQGETVAAQRALDAALDPNTGFVWSAIARGLPSATSSGSGDSFTVSSEARELFDLMALVSNGEFEKASSRVNVLLEDPQLRRSQHLKEITAVTPLLTNGAAASASLTQIKIDLRAITPRLDELRKRYDRLQTLTSDLFSLPHSDSDASSELEFYKEGVLSDLPVASPLPDGIASLSDLKRVLERTGGKVAVPDNVAEPHLYFSQKVNEIRAESKIIAASRKEIVDERAALLKDEEFRAAEITRIRGVVVSSLQNTILSVFSAY